MRTEVETKQIKDIAELEFRYLKELSELKTKTEAEKQKADSEFKEKDEAIEIIRDLCDIGYNPSRLKFIGLIDDEVGLFLTLDYADNEIFEIADKGLIRMSQDENVVIIKDGYENYTFVHKEMFDKEYLEQMKKQIEKLKEENRIYRYFHIKDNQNTYRVITKDLAEASIQIAVEEAEAEKQKAEARAKERALEKDKKTEEKRADYEQKGLYKAEEDEIDDDSKSKSNSGIIIEGNILKRVCNYGRTYKFEFIKPINSFLTFDEVKDLDDSEQNKLLQLFISKRIDFTNWYGEDNKEIGKLSFQGDRIKINDIPVTKAKVLFILGKIRYNQNDKEKIALYNKLSGMKVEVLELKDIEFHLNGINRGCGENGDKDKLTMPISITLLDENMFKFTMFDKAIPLNWERIKHYFFESDCGGGDIKVGRRTHIYFGLKKFQELTAEMGMDRAFVFENLNKLRLFNAI